MSANSVHSLSRLEYFSLTSELLKETDKWNHYKKNPQLGSLGAKTVGFMATPLTCLIDFFAHGLFFVGKTCGGVFISAYNGIAVQFSRKYLAPKELELSSAMVHQARAVESFARAFILGFIILMDYRKGCILAQEVSGETIKTLRKEQANNTVLKKKAEMADKTIEVLSKEVLDLELSLKDATESLEETKKQYHETISLKKGLHGWNKELIIKANQKELELLAAKQETEELKLAHAIFKEQLTGVTAEKNSLQGENEDLKNANLQLKQQIKELMSQAAALQIMNQKLHDQCIQKESELLTVKKESEKLKEDNAKLGAQLQEEIDKAEKKSKLAKERGESNKKEILELWKETCILFDKFDELKQPAK